MKLIDAVIWITVSVLNVWWKVTGKPYIHTITYAIETTEHGSGKCRNHENFAGLGFGLRMAKRFGTGETHR